MYVRTDGSRAADIVEGTSKQTGSTAHTISASFSDWGEVLAPHRSEWIVAHRHRAGSCGLSVLTDAQPVREVKLTTRLSQDRAR